MEAAARDPVTPTVQRDEAGCCCPMTRPGNEGSRDPESDGGVTAEGGGDVGSEPGAAGGERDTSPPLQVPTRKV